MAKLDKKFAYVQEDCYKVPFVSITPGSFLATAPTRDILYFLEPFSHGKSLLPTEIKDLIAKGCKFFIPIKFVQEIYCKDGILYNLDDICRLVHFCTYHKPFRITGEAEIWSSILDTFPINNSITSFVKQRSHVARLLAGFSSVPETNFEPTIEVSSVNEETHTCDFRCIVTRRTLEAVVSRSLCDKQLHTLFTPSDTALIEFSPLVTLISVATDLKPLEKTVISTIETAIATSIAVYQAASIEAATSILLLAIKALSAQFRNWTADVTQFLMSLLPQLFHRKAGFVSDLKDDVSKYFEVSEDLGRSKVREILFSIIFTLVLVPVTLYKFGSNSRFTLTDTIKEISWYTWSYSDNVSILMTGLTHILKYGAAFATGGASSVLFTGAEAAHWHELAFTISSYRDQMDAIDSGLLESLGIIDVNSYLIRVTVLREQGDLLYGKAAKSRNFIAMSNIERAVKSLVEAYRLSNKYIISAGLRRAPATFLLAGESGIAKTMLAGAVRTIYGKLFGLPVDRGHMYKLEKSEFKDSYHTSMWCLLADDMGAIKVTIEPDPVLMDIVNIVNNAPYITNQADLPDKGVIPLNASLLIVTTNNQEMQSRLYYAYPSAAVRRFPFILKPTVKAEYKNEAGIIDGDKIEQDMNCWIFTVQEPVIVGKEFTYRNIHTDLEWNEVVPIIVAHFRKHRATQDKFLADIHAMEDWSICEHDTTFHTCGHCSTKILDVSEAYSAPIHPNDFDGFSEVSDVKVAHDFGAIGHKVKKTLIMAGAKISEAIPDDNTKLLAGAASIAALTFGVSQIFGHYSSDDGPDTPSVQPAASAFFTPPAYLQRNFQPTFSQQQLSGSKGHLLKLLTNNMFVIHVYCKGVQGAKVHALCIGGQQFITVRHIFGEFEGTPKPTHFTIARVGVTPTKDLVAIDHSNVIVDEELDLALFNCYKFAPASSIEKYIYSKDLDLGTSVSSRTLLNKFVARTNMSEMVEIKGMLETRLGVENNKRIMYSMHSVPATVGSCSSPLVIEGSTGMALIGILNAYDKKQHAVSYYTPISANTVNILKAKLITANLVVQKAGCVTTPELSVYRDSHYVHEHAGLMEPLSAKSSWNWLDGPKENLGTYFGPSPKMESNIFTTFCHDQVAEIIPTILDYTVPRFRPPKINGIPDVSVSPTAVKCAQMCLPKATFTSSDINDAVFSYVSKLTSNAKFMEEVSNLVPLTLEQVFNGSDYERRMDFSTSMGFPERGIKHSKLQVLEEENHTFTFNDEQLEAYESLDKSMRNCEYNGPVFIGSFKQEALKKKKNDAGLIRMFFGGSILFTAISRKYLLPLMSIMKKYPHLTEQLIGVRSDSKAWTTVAENLAAGNSGKVGCGDFKTHDLTMPANIILGVFSVFISLLEHSKYSEEDMNAVRSLASDTAYPVISVKNDCARFSGINPSGGPATTIINSVAVSIYCRIGYGHSSIRPPETFRQCLLRFNLLVWLYTYGDDSLFSTSDLTFNQNSMQKAMAKFGIGYTDFLKNDEFPDFYNLSQAEFLKRKFTAVERDGETVYVDPLNLNSIGMMFSYGKKSVLLEEERFYSAMLSAKSELVRYLIIDPNDENTLKLWHMATSAIRVLNPKVPRSDHWREDVLASFENEREPVTQQELDLMLEEFAVGSTHKDFIPDLIFASSGPSTTIETKQAQVVSEDPIATETQGTVTFADLPEEITRDTTLIVPKGVSMYKNTEIASLGNVLGRAHLIYSGPLANGSALHTQINTVSEFFNNTFIQNKIQNYGRMRFTANYRLVINGNPAHQLLVATGWIANVNDSNGNKYTVQPYVLGTQSSNFAITTSLPGPSRPLNACDSPVLEFAIPWLSPANYGDVEDMIGTQSDYTTPENIIFLTSLGALKSANGSAIDLSISLFMWLTDVELIAPRKASSPATTVIKEVNNEFTDSSQISGIASRFASAFGLLDDLPIVGRYSAMASKVSSTVANVAASWGFSKPTQPLKIEHMRPQNFSSFANLDGVDSSVKLTFDSKQAIEADRSLIGVSAIDEMSYQHVGSVPGMIGHSDWEIGQAEGTILAEWVVTPTYMLGPGSITTGEPRWMTPQSYLSAPHTHAGGSIIYTIVFETSKWHAGRMLFSWTPFVSDTFDQFPDNTNYTVVIDIHETTQVAIRVPWLGANPVRPIDKTLDQAGAANNYNFTNTVIPDSTFEFNGKCRLIALNELVAPGAAADVNFAVFAQLGEDFIFQGSSTMVADIQLAASGAMDPLHCDIERNIVPLSDVIDLGSGVQNEALNKASLSLFGERVVSLRALAKRFIRNRSVLSRITNGGSNSFTHFTFQDASMPNVYSTGIGPESVPDQAHWTGSGTSDTTVCTTYLSYVRHCYQGFRGGKRTKCILNSQSTLSAYKDSFTISVTRNMHGYNSNLDWSGLTAVQQTTSPIVDNMRPRDFKMSGGSGMHVVTNKVNNTLEYEIPYYSHFNFLPGNANYNTVNNMGNSTPAFEAMSQLDAVVDMAVDLVPSIFFIVGADFYHAAADDFDCVCFVTSPVINTT